MIWLELQETQCVFNGFMLVEELHWLILLESRLEANKVTGQLNY